MSYMSTQRFRLPFTLPSFNEIEEAAHRPRTYGELKYRTQANIVAVINRAKLLPVLPGVSIMFTWHEKDRRRDPFDLRAGSKFIMDALCGPDRDGDRQPRAGILHCDGWHCINDPHDVYEVTADAPGVEVAIYGVLR
jgi:hypothetical protein